MKLFRFHKSFSPVLIALPHAGTFIPPEIAVTMTDAAREDAPTDKHLLKLCDCSALRDVGLIATNASPLIVNLARMLPATMEGPLETFYRTATSGGQPVYQETPLQLTDQQHRLRRETFYLPYFQKLLAELNRMDRVFGKATLLLLEALKTQSAEIELAITDPQAFDFSNVARLANQHSFSFTCRTLSQDEIGDDAILNAAINDSLTTDTEKAFSPQIGRLSVGPPCFLDQADWSAERADATRAIIAALVERLI